MAPSAADTAVTRDPDAAREFQEAYGFNANAEDIIQANAARRSKELKIAQRIQTVDEDRTAKLGFAGAAKAAKVDKSKVRDMAVRGGFVVVVYEDERGDYRKIAVPDTDTDFELTPDENADRVRVQGEAAKLAASRKAREEQQRLAKEAVEQGNREGAEAVQAAVAEARKDHAAAVKKAETAREKSDEGS